MILNEIIEEEDEEKSNHKNYNNNNFNNIKKLNKNNINIKDEKDNKDKKINKVNHSHKSVSAPKDNKESRIHISNCINNDLNINEKELNKVKALLDNRNENNFKLHLPSINKNINYSLEKNKIMNNNNRQESPSTSAFTNSNKKYLVNGHNYTEEISKYRMGLLSANSSSNNNSIIPMLPIKRPVSNFNFGGNPLWEINNHNNINQNDLNIEKNIDSINNKNNNAIIIGKSSINKAPIIINSFSQRNDIDNFNKTSNKNKNNVKNLDFKKSVSLSKYNYNNVDNLSNNVKNNNDINIKMHKFKIEKGLMSNRLTNIFNEQLNNYKKSPNQNNRNNILQKKNGVNIHSVKKNF